MTPPEGPDVASLVAALEAKTQALGSSEDADEARKQALMAARQVVAALETPPEVIMYYSAVVRGELMSLKMGVDLRLFHILAGASAPLTSAQLAQETGAEELLIVRVMRIICSMRFARETDVQTYAATANTHGMTHPGLEGAAIIAHDYDAMIKLPDFFKARGYRCTTDARDSPFQWVHKTDKTYFEVIHQSAASMRAFNDFMGVIRSGRKFWADWFDVSGRVLDGFSFADREPLLIDIGGGDGHDLEQLVARYPNTAGHLVLQDLPSVIAASAGKGLAAKGIEAVGHDFFKEQPIKGARVYYMHFCLHDWPDKDCQTILSQIKAAMKPGYSKILLNESVLPDKDCPSWFASIDIDMMAILSGMQRSRRQWFKLIESVGLEVVDVWSSPYDDDAEGIIEAVLKS